MDETLLLNAIHVDPCIRVPSEKYIASLESNAGFLYTLFMIYQQSTNPTSKLAALLLAKNVINRQWHVVGTTSKSAPVSDAEKTQIKEFLLNRLFIDAEWDMKLRELLMICVATISKQHFYDLWAQLEDYLVLRSQNPDEDVLKLLNLVIKIQIRRRIKRAQFKEFATKLYSNIKNAWMLANSEILDKIMLKLMTVIQDSESVIAFLLKAKALVNNPDCEILLKDLLKGINLIDASFPDLLIGQVLAEYIEINCVILSIVKPADNPDKAALLRQSCFNLKEMMISNPHAQIILKDKSEWLLQKIIEQEGWGERWELWRHGETQEFLQHHDQADETYLRKLLVALLKVYPDLSIHIPVLAAQIGVLPFPKSHAVCTLIGIVPNLRENGIECNISLQQIIGIFSNLSRQGFDKLIILRDALWIFRKWVKVIADYQVIYSIIRTIRQNCDNDIIIIYEICLTLKQLLYQNIPSSICHDILQYFSGDIFFIIKQSSIPQMIWNMISLVSALINMSAFEKNPGLLSAFQASGLSEIFNSDSELIINGLVDMFEGLINLYPEEPIIIEAVSSFLLNQAGKTNMEKCFYLLHFLVANMEAVKSNVSYVEPLLVLLKSFDSKQRGLGIKILEEFLLLLQATGTNHDEISKFIDGWCLPICNLEGNVEHDGLSLALLTTIATVDFSKVQNGFGQYAQYLSVPKTDTYATLCILTSLYLVNKCILDNNECMNYIDPNGWLGAMSVLSSSNHKKINAAALLKMLNYMNETVIQANAGLIFRYIVLPIENYKNSTSTVSPQRPEHRRPNSNQLSPSKRKINYMNKDPAVNINLLVSLKHTINSLKNRGIFFENWLNTEERHRFEELLKDGHHRSSSK